MQMQVRMQVNRGGGRPGAESILAERYAREGVDLSVSTLADQVGGCAALLRPLYDLIHAHVFAAGRVHGDDTTVPVLAKGKTRTGRLWTYVRDDRRGSLRCTASSSDPGCTPCPGRDE